MGSRFNQAVRNFNQLAKEKKRAAKKAAGAQQKHKLAVKLQARSNSRKKQRLVAHRERTLERFAKDDKEKEAASTGASTPAAGGEVDMGDAQKAVKRAVARAAKKGRKQAGVAKMQE